MSDETYKIAIRVSEFWFKVKQSDPDDCWPWTGYINPDGYGEFCFDGRMVGSHELAITFTTGERRLPGLDTCHSCGHRPCCNPRHLRFDTSASNIADTVRMGRNHRDIRLSGEQVRLIRMRREAGAAQQDLAEQFGVSNSYISMIVNGLVRIKAGGPIQNSRRRYRRAS